MRYELSDDQVDLVAMARRFFADATEADREEVLAGRPGQDPKVWARLTQELGLAGIAIAEHDGGAGGSWLDLALVLEEAGAAVSSQPLLATTGASVAVLRVAAEIGSPATSEAVRPLLAAIAAGERTATWVDAARPGATITAATENGGWTVTGQQAHVLHGNSADIFLVTAATPGGVGLFMVEQENVTELIAERSLDPTRALATVRFAGSTAHSLHTGMNEAALRRAQAIIRILLAAEQVGVGQGVLDLAVEYAKTRNQFGRPIGGFQAIKHLLADAYADVDTARVVARHAAWSLSDLDGEGVDLVELAALTAAHVSVATERTAAAALQVFGGVGYTWEHPGHLYYKRAVTAARLLGTTDEHLDVIAAGLDLGHQ